MIIPTEGDFSLLHGIGDISLSLILRDIDYLFPPFQQRPTASKPSVGYRSLSEHASDFSMDREAHADDLPHPSKVLRSELFDLSEYPQQKEGFVGDVSASEGCGSGGPSGLDAGASKGRPYNLQTQVFPPDKYTHLSIGRRRRKSNLL
ncbi:uncharacterized protein DS421_11g336410 [Arachis hypogaea]|nr:uncharacterized protein DS421_11g336410 [Arachis hypogaea]